MKRTYSALFGDRWRVPFIKHLSFGAEVGASRGDCVILCGCYIPSTVTNYYDVVGPQGRILAIEANPANAKKLQDAIQSNPSLRNAHNISVLSKGVWDKPGTATFIANEGEYAGLDKIDNEQLRDFSYHKVDKTREVTIETDSLDNILRQNDIKHVDYVVFTINDAELVASRWN